MAYTPTDNPYIPGDPYSYDLKWIVAKIKEALTGIEGLTTGQSNLSNDFEELKEYVYNYFDNLDISQEVEAKINELYAAGFFDDIIEGWMNGHIKWTNPNLVDNPWFTIRQRGNGPFTYESGKYTADRWLFTYSGATGSVVLNNSGANITRSDVPGQLFFSQRIVNADLEGRQVTLSAIIDGNLRTLTGICPAKTSSEQIFLNSLENGVFLQLKRAPSSSTVDYTLSIAANNSTTHIVKAVKLEIGPYSTLANDTIPDYTIELMKCQRYFQKIVSNEDSTIAFGLASSSASVGFILYLPVPMRITPTATISGSLAIPGVGNYSTCDVAGLKNNILTLRLTGTFTADKMYRINITANNNYINLSADL